MGEGTENYEDDHGQETHPPEPPQQRAPSPISTGTGRQQHREKDDDTKKEKDDAKRSQHESTGRRHRPIPSPASAAETPQQNPHHHRNRPTPQTPEQRTMHPPGAPVTAPDPLGARSVVQSTRNGRERSQVAFPTSRGLPDNRLPGSHQPPSVHNRAAVSVTAYGRGRGRGGAVAGRFGRGDCGVPLNTRNVGRETSMMPVAQRLPLASDASLARPFNVNVRPRASSPASVRPDSERAPKKRRPTLATPCGATIPSLLPSHLRNLVTRDIDSRQQEAMEEKLSHAISLLFDVLYLFRTMFPSAAPRDDANDDYDDDDYDDETEDDEDGEIEASRRAQYRLRDRGSRR